MRLSVPISFWLPVSSPLFIFNDMFHLRGEFYGFMPIFPIEKNTQNKAFYGKAFSKVEYMGEVSVICHYLLERSLLM